MTRYPFQIGLRRQVRIIKRHLKDGHKEKMLNAVRVLRPADVADVLGYLQPEEGASILNLLTAEEAASIMRELDVAVRKDLLQELEEKHLSDILEAMPPDDAADILAFLPEEEAEDVLELMEEEEAEDVEELMKYEEDTAGGIMTPDYIAFGSEMTVAQAIEELRRKKEVESISYIYVVDEENHLTGILSLRGLITAQPETPLKEIMERELISVTPDLDQEEVANLVKKYNLRALPVVDGTNTILGRITVDDVLDVVEEEATEDIYKMGGTDDEELLNRSTLKVAQVRLPWLLICLAGGLICAAVITFFETTLTNLITLAAFIPVIMAMGGNVGMQSSTIVVRGIATGHIDVSQVRRLFLREVKIGIIMGFACGLLVGAFAYLRSANPVLGIVVAVAMFTALTVAAGTGMFIPVVFKRFNIDPAIAAGPFITTLTDITGLLIYFYLGSVLMQVL